MCILMCVTQHTYVQSKKQAKIAPVENSKRPGSTGLSWDLRQKLAIALFDAHAVTPLHALICPRRHAATFFDLYEPERRAINLLLDDMRRKVLAKDKDIQGFNVGMNCGTTAGQTIMHCHVHLIPRRPGDVDQPRGGVRAVIPGKAAY